MSVFDWLAEEKRVPAIFKKQPHAELLCVRNPEIDRRLVCDKTWPAFFVLGPRGGSVGQIVA